MHCGCARRVCTNDCKLCAWNDATARLHGAKYRRLKGRLGAPKAIVAMAHHLARLVYRMLRYGPQYIEEGMAECEIKFRLQRLK